MNAISLYVSASRLLLQSDAENPNYSDLYRLVPYLRQSLSCAVCANLLVEPYSPQVCQHHVCKKCVGGRKNLKPTCTSCKTYSNYSSNAQLRILLQCYKSLCSYILATPAIYSTMHKYVHVDAISNGTNEAHNLPELIDEGAQFHDEYKSNSGLPKSAFSILPCIFTSQPSSSSQNQNNTNNMTSMPTKKTISTNQSTPTINEPTFVRISAPNQVTLNAGTVSSTSEPKEKFTVVSNSALMKNPTMKTVSNGTALYSVLYTGAGNKITIKRKTDDTTFTTANTMSTKEMLNIISVNSPKIQQHSHIQQIQPIQSQAQKIHVTTASSSHRIHTMPNIITSQTPNFKIQTINTLPKTLLKRKGCRCGNATPTPGKLTCCGQRCPCYVESKSCVDCKCRGCRNPHRIDGLKVRPPIAQLACIVPMSSQQQIEKKYLTMPLETFGTAPMTHAEPRIKQEIQDVASISNVVPDRNSSMRPLHQKLDLVKSNDTIEYMSNDLDDGNIQVVNVYTTHMPDISSTLPTIIMQDEASSLSHSSSSAAQLSLQNHLTLPSDSYSLMNDDDLIKQTFSDDGCSSGDQSDVEIDL